jgi:FkbM family methyltransferase
MTGIILAQNNEATYLKRCLEPWVVARKEAPILIVCLDVSFAENGGGNSTDGSLELIQQYKKEDKIDHFEILPPNLKEHEARNVGLKWLLDKGCDLIISIGVDEFYSVLEIRKILNYINSQPLIAVFKIHYKNYVFDQQHYILGFKPNRVWRVSCGKYRLVEFFNDDDCLYKDADSGCVRDSSLPCKVIPNSVAFVGHYTWLNDERSRRKVEYQEKHMGNVVGDPKAACSFRWDHNLNCLKWNEEYYKKTGQPLPEVFEEIVHHNTPFGKFILDPEDGVCRVIKTGEFWDEWLKEYLDQLGPQDVMIDAGAHIAFHTVYAASRCKHVHCFEPQTVNYDRILQNIELNNLTNVTPYNFALYNKETRMFIDGRAQSSINYSASQACSLSLKENEAGDIQTKTLDSFGLENVTFIKVDAEFTDLEVLMGGVETIKKCRPLIIFEYSMHDQAHMRFFKELNYSVKEITACNFIARPKF